MPTTLDGPYDVACAFLAAAFDALELTDEGAPGRRYVSPGEASMDCCGEIVVWTSSLSEADSSTVPAVKKLRQGVQPLLTVIVRATRCVPTGEETGGRLRFPDPADLQAAAQMVEQDGWALFNHLAWELRHGTLASVCAGAYRDGAVKLTQQGGCAGWQLTFRYPIEGGAFGT